MSCPVGGQGLERSLLHTASQKRFPDTGHQEQIGILMYAVQMANRKKNKVD